MREILFKAKRKSDGKWVEGDLVHGVGKERGLCFIWEEDENCVLNCREHIVDPETISQYTGLCDKNGRKIWENDLLDCQDRITVVKWNVPCGTWDSIFVRYKGQLCSNGINVAEWKYRAEVIGNRFDNLNLLEGGN